MICGHNKNSGDKTVELIQFFKKKNAVEIAQLWQHNRGKLHYSNNSFQIKVWKVEICTKWQYKEATHYPNEKGFFFEGLTTCRHYLCELHVFFFPLVLSSEAGSVGQSEVPAFITSLFSFFVFAE